MGSLIPQLSELTITGQMKGRVDRWKENTSNNSHDLDVRKIVDEDLNVQKADFPEEMVEKIISKMPFPSLFKARVLSRSWYFKFPLPSQCVKSLSPTLQNLVTSVSSKWPTYCPVFFSHGEGILGFDRVSFRWQSMLTLSYLPVTSWSSITSGGSLICVVSESDVGYSVFVTNVITRSWRKLPTRPFCEEPDHVRLVPVGSDAYKVLLVYRRSHDEDDGVHTQVYDSSLRSWTMKKSMVDLDTFCVNSAYLDGKLYCMCHRINLVDALQLWSYYMEDNTWVAIPHNFNPEDFIGGAVLLCGDKVMVAIWFLMEEDEMNCEIGLYTLKNSIGIYQLDLKSLNLQEVARGPQEIMVGVGIVRQQILFSSDADFIYFGQTIPSSPVLTYNVHSHEWNCIPPASYTYGSMDNKTWLEFAFQPGLNPFVMV